MKTLAATNSPISVPYPVTPGRDFEMIFSYDGVEYMLLERHTGRIPKNVGYKRKGSYQLHYGFDLKFYYKNNYPHHMPYFHVTSDVYAPNGRNVGGGASIQGNKRFEKADFFHLWDWPGVPMHYEANSIYQLQCALGVGQYMNDKDRNYIEAFKNTCGFGLAPGDEEIFAEFLKEFGWQPASYALMPNNAIFPLGWQTEQIKKWLRQEISDKARQWLPGRLPYLNAAFIAEMVRLKVAVPIDKAPYKILALEAGDVQNRAISSGE